MLVLDGEHPTSTLTFTPDNKQLITVHWEGETLDIWTLATSERKKLASTTAGFSGTPVVHPSGETVYIGGYQLRSISLKDGKNRTLPKSAGREVITSPDGEWVITTARAAGLHGYRCEPNGTLQVPPAWQMKAHVVHEAPGGFLGTGEQFVTADQKVLVIRDTKTGELKSTVPSPDYAAVRA